MSMHIADVYADSVRELCKADYELEVIAYWVVSTPPESRLRVIDSGSLWVAEVGGVIAGYLVSVPGELVALFISSSYAGLGMGKALAQLGIEIAEGDFLGEVKLRLKLGVIAKMTLHGHSTLFVDCWYHCA